MTRRSSRFARARTIRHCISGSRGSLGEFVSQHIDTIVSGDAPDLLGTELASDLGWNDCVVVRLPASNGELAGLLAALLGDAAHPLGTGRKTRDLIEAISRPRRYGLG